MELLLLVLALFFGLIVGFAFGASYSSVASGFATGLFIAALLALDLHLLGAASLYCWCLFGANMTGFVISASTPDDNSLKRYFDIRREL